MFPSKGLVSVRDALRWRHVLRLPLAWWCVVALLSALTAAVVWLQLAAATRARAAYGRTVTVAVVQRHIAAGDRLGAGDLRLVARPAGVVPTGALTRLPEGRTAKVALVPGEVLVRSRVADAGIDGVAALVPSGWRALAVPADVAALPALQAGDRVDVLVTAAGVEVAAGDGPQEAPTVVVAENAVVVGATDDAVTIAVPAAATTRVAYGVTTQAITLALRG